MKNTTGTITNGTITMNVHGIISKLSGFILSYADQNDEDRRWFPRNNVPDDVKTYITKRFESEIFPLYVEYKIAKQQGDLSKLHSLMNKIQGIQSQISSDCNKKFAWKGY